MCGASAICEDANSLGLERPVIVITGPTASGKSAIAQAFALRVDGEVVSADSMQVYRGMDIGTGKVVPAQQVVPHHGIDLLDPGEPFSAALFQDYARSCFEDIDRRGRQSFLCGGTGFYIRAAIDDYRFPEGEQVGNVVRDRFLAIARDEGPHALWLLLEAADPESAGIIPENDVKKVVRAFELLDAGTTYAQQKRALAQIPQRVPAVFLGLSVKPEVLAQRIDRRVDAMVEDGLLEEVESLLDQGFREGVTAPQAIGYKEIVEVIDGKKSLDQAIEDIKTATRRYAKRQRTWLRKERRMHWFDADTLNVDDITERMANCVAKID